jgi:hypothetical protein
MTAEASSSQTRARRRGAISITVVLTPISIAEDATSSPINPAPMTSKDRHAARPSRNASASASVRK